MRAAAVASALISLALVGPAATGAADRATSGAVCVHRLATPSPSEHADAANVLVPSGAIAVRICRYRDLNTNPKHRLGLVADRRYVAPTTVAPLVEQFDGLPRYPEQETIRLGCFDDGARIVAWFEYAGGISSPVVVSMGNCPDASNGRTSRDALSGNGRALIARLAALTPYPVVCGRALSTDERVPVVFRATRPGQYSTGMPGLGGHPLALRFTRDCGSGVRHVTIRPKGVVEIARRVVARDGLTAGLLLRVPARSGVGRATLTATFRSGSAVRVLVDTCVTCGGRGR